MIALEEAWERLLALAPPLAATRVAVDDATGRVLAAPLMARRTQPAADLSVMDGFAVAGSGPWRIIGEARAGHPFAGRLQAGEAVRIATGAACPDGAEGIVLLEDGTVADDILDADHPEAGRWVRRRGFDFAAGDTLLATGTRIGPAQLALARAAGHAELAVGRQPRVAVLDIGDELVADPRDCPPDRLPASNAAMVAAMARGVGAAARTIGPLPDDHAALVAALRDVDDEDVLVTTAGASVGAHDHVRGALAVLGAELAFWRVAIRPGKPLLVARLGSQIVLGLPGNPNSSFVTAFLFLLPLLRAMQGAVQPLPSTFALPLAAPLPPGEDRRELRRGRFINGRVAPLPERDSSALATLAAADVLIDRPIDAPAAAPGELVACYWIGNGAMA